MAPKKTTFGSMPKTMPPGYFKAVNFPVLAMMDTKTGDRRLLASDGGGTRDLPVGIRYQPAATYGHEGAVPSGALFEVTLDPATKVVSGRGFLLDDPNGHVHFRMIATGAQRGNSVDLAETKARFVEDLSNGDYWLEFTQWNIAATTGVGTPAFANAHATVDFTPDELTAAIGDPMEEIVAGYTPEEWAANSIITYQVPQRVSEVDEELLAAYAASDPIPHELFFRSESDELTKIVVTASGEVYGHITGWELTHDGFPGQQVRCPRPTDGYASFNKPGVLTDKGIVATGPIFLLGGHRSAKSAPTIEQAYGGIENTWADVRVIEGKLGPWISGIVRPGASPDAVYAARASRISGHWVGTRLKAIVSVNAEGFDVAGNPELEFIASAGDGFAFSVQENAELELVAGLGTPTDGLHGLESLTALQPEEIAKLRELIASAQPDEPAAGLASDAERDALAAALALSMLADD